MCALAILLLACGARDGLFVGDTAGAASSSSSGSGSSSSGGGAGGQPTCNVADLSTWTAEHYRDNGDYERAVAATSGVPWIALKVKGHNLVFMELGIDDQGILVKSSFEVPESPVYPVAFDVSDTRFVVLTTTGINWNGDVALWSIDRATGTAVQTPIGDPVADPAYGAGSALGLVGDDIGLAYERIVSNQGTVELRGPTLDLIASATVDDIFFYPVRRGPNGLDIHAGKTSVFHLEAGSITSAPADPVWHMIGGLEGYLVQYDLDMRMIHGDEAWIGPWPHTQVSPPAVVREHGGSAVFSLNTELTGVVGYPRGADLQWMPIEPAPGASGLGVALMPLFEEGRVGFFYLGIEIPKPEQPLRYFGRVCR